jgi:hypothetical protein
VIHGGQTATDAAEILEEEATTEMATRCWLTAFLTCAVTMSNGARSSASQIASEVVLKERGLSKLTTKDGVYWIFGSESVVLDGLHRINVLIDNMEYGRSRILACQELEMAIMHAQSVVIDLEAQRRILQTRVLSSLGKDDLNNARILLNHTTEQLSIASAELQKKLLLRLSPAQKQELQEGFDNAKLVFLEAEAKLRPLYDATMNRYREFQQDPDVRGALNAYGAWNKVRSVLGPSPTMKKGIGEMKAAESSYSPETAPRPTRRKKSARTPLKVPTPAQSAASRLNPRASQ